MNAIIRALAYPGIHTTSAPNIVTTTRAPLVYTRENIATMPVCEVITADLARIEADRSRQADLFDRAERARSFQRERERLASQAAIDAVTDAIAASRAQLQELTRRLDRLAERVESYTRPNPN